MFGKLCVNPVENGVRSEPTNRLRLFLGDRLGVRLSFLAPERRLGLFCFLGILLYTIKIS